MKPEKEFSVRFDLFVQIQNENKLADLQIDGIYIWRLIRGQLFTKMLEDQNVISKPEKKTQSIAGRIAIGTHNLASSIFRPSKWKQFPKAISSLRTFLIDAINSITSLALTSRLIFGGSKKSFFISAFIRNIGTGYRLTKPAEDKYTGDYILLDKPTAGLFSMQRMDTRAFNIIARRFFKKNIISDIEPVVKKISEAYGIEPETITRLVKKNINTFKAHEAAFSHFFSKSNFSKLYLCWNRYYMPLLSAAKKADIETSEFQHGTITPYHIMYSWEGYNDIAYSPDRLLCFGPSWHENSNLTKSIIPEVIGAPHIENCKKKHASIKPEENRVVVFSQNLIGLKLLEFSIKVARLRPDLTFIFKPHPAERYVDITHYIEGDMPSNFEFAAPSDDSYALMASASYQIGVSSTTLNEGMIFGNRVIIVAYSSWEYLENSIELGHANLVHTPEEAAKTLNTNAPLCDNPQHYYADIDLSRL